jgi:subtilisin family serine protease
MKIRDIWDKYGEKGGLARVLILDTGINRNLSVFNGIIESQIQNFAINSTDTFSNDENCHGTHCAGLIASFSASYKVGIAPQSKLLVGKITENGQLKDGTTLKNALREYLKPDYDFDIISISQTIVQNDTELENLILEHIKMKKIIIAAIGNDSTNRNSAWKRFPGFFDSCISVGACESDQSLSPYTCSPGKAAIYCYGSNVGSYKKSEIPEALTGTSQATAIVAGICSLLVSFLKSRDIDFDQEFIRKLLQEHSIPLTGGQNYKLIDPMTIFTNILTTVS